MFRIEERFVRYAGVEGGRNICLKKNLKTWGKRDLVGTGSSLGKEGNPNGTNDETKDGTGS